METAIHWRPIKIEKYFKDVPDILIVWKSLKIKEEKQVPFYADEPIATSKEFDMTGYYRTNFRPHKDRVLLAKIAMHFNISSLPVDTGEAFRKVVNHIKNI